MEYRLPVPGSDGRFKDKHLPSRLSQEALDDAYAGGGGGGTGSALKTTDQALYVSPLGSESNDGLSPGKPKLSLAAAAAALPTNGGTVYVLGGQHDVGGSPIVLRNGLNIVGVGRQASRIRSTSGPVFAWDTNVSDVHIGGVYLRATSDHIFKPGPNGGAFLSSVENCTLDQGGTGYSIWYQDNATSFIDNLFSDCDFYRAPSSTVPAFFLRNSVGALNNNRWENSRVNSRNSTAAPFFFLESTGNGAPAVNNYFTRLTGEQNRGGLIQALSVDGLFVDDFPDWDVTATYTASLVTVGKSSAAGAPLSRNINLKSVGRRGGTMEAGVNDINCIPAECVIVKMDQCNPGSGSPALAFPTGSTILMNIAGRSTMEVHGSLAHALASGTFGAFGATPVAKPLGTTDIRAALIALGLYSSGGASPLNLNGGVLTAASLTIGTTQVQKLYGGTGSPEGTQAAPPGSGYLNGSGGVGTTWWVKESGTGNTGWAPMASPEGGARPVGKGELVVNVLDYGVVGNNVVDDTSALVAAAAAAVAKKRTLWLPPGLVGMRITSAVDLRMIDVKFESNVVVAHTNDIGLRLGGSSTNAIRRTAYLHSVLNAAANPAFPSLRFTGLKNGLVTVGACDYMQLFADGNVTDSNSLAYSQFHLGRKIAKLELTSQNDMGWINENTFHGGAIDTLIVSGSYSHNSNWWIKPSIEGASSSITFNVGTSNHIMGARGEGSPTLTFAEGTSHNLVTAAYQSNPTTLAPSFTVVDNGVSNVVQSTIGSAMRAVEVLRIDSDSRIFDSCAEFPHVIPPTPGLQYLKIKTANQDVFDSGLIPLEQVGVGPLSAEGVHRVKQFILSSSHTVWRPVVEVYDSNKVLLDTTAAVPYISLVGGWASSGAGTAYAYSALTPGARILVQRSEVKYIRIHLRSSSSNVAFDWVSIAAYVPNGHIIDGIAQKFRKSTQRPLFQTTTPTQGAAYPGEVVNSATGRFTCVSRVDTTLTAAVAAGATALPVAKITGVVTDDVVGVLLADGTTHWSKVSVAPASLTITLTTAIPTGGALSGAPVVTNRWLGDGPAVLDSADTDYALLG